MAKQTQDSLHNINFRITADELARLDRLADKYGISRSQYLRNIVVLSIEEDETFEKFGIVRAAITVRDILYWIDDKRKKVTENLEEQGSVKA